VIFEEMLMEVSKETAQSPTRLYRRELPGAGYVEIDVTSSVADAADQVSHQSRIRVFVERRASEERRAGHAPPVVAEFAGDHGAPEVAELYRMASDNAALARALIEWQWRQQRSARAD
jgi:hypothetical protein